jgi:hypothetical protein
MHQGDDADNQQARDQERDPDNMIGSIMKNAS